jgi:phosphoribosylformylglycinamidine cyclo-ligase
MHSISNEAGNRNKMRPSSSMSSDRYAARGVFAQKQDVHAAVSKLDPGLYPRAFCKIVPDVLTGNSDFCIAMHSDGAGTKAGMAYLVYKETGDLGVFRGIAQDALVMNIDDLLCVGSIGPFMVSNTIARNRPRIPPEVIDAIINGYENVASQFREWGVNVVITGGETADLGDLTGTLIVDSVVAARLQRNEVISNERIKSGDVIIGLASFGQSVYEKVYNSGIGSNGLTSARHELLHHSYAALYPETYDPQMDPALVYCGPYHLGDNLPGTPISVGQALLSPTRTYTPLIRDLLQTHRSSIGSLIHCTGSGQTKRLRQKNGIRYILDKLFDVPPIFRAIQEESGTSWREMYKVFNMGHRFEIIGPESLVSVVQDLGTKWGIETRVIGRCEASSDGERNQLTLHTPGGIERYEGP